MQLKLVLDKEYVSHEARIFTSLAMETTIDK
jgi:hypothetical protein